jgi:hypothetical protein
MNPANTDTSKFLTPEIAETVVKLGVRVYCRRFTQIGQIRFCDEGGVFGLPRAFRGLTQSGFFFTTDRYDSLSDMAKREEYTDFTTDLDELKQRISEL